MTENNNNELPSEETVAAHLEEHADMFAPEPSNIPDDATQTLSVAELKELLDFAFAQGRLRGFFDGQQELLKNIDLDEAVDQGTKDYLKSLHVEGESE
jgi:hypothetical protein